MVESGGLNQVLTVEPGKRFRADNVPPLTPEEEKQMHLEDLRRQEKINAVIEAENKQLRENIEELTAANVKLVATLHDRMQDIKQLRESADGRANNRDEIITKQEAELAAIRSERDSLKAANDKLQADIADLKKTVDADTGVINELQTHITKLEQKPSNPWQAMRIALETLTENISGIEKQYAEAMRVKTTVNSKLAQLLQDIGGDDTPAPAVRTLQAKSYVSVQEPNGKPTPREIRKSKGLKCVEAAKKLGLSTHQLNMAESGQNCWKASVIPKICELYGIKPEDVYWGRINKAI